MIEGDGKIVMPAGIDVHTQFTAQQSVDDVGRGCKAAVARGTATVRDLRNGLGRWERKESNDFSLCR